MFLLCAAHLLDRTLRDGKEEAGTTIPAFSWYFDSAQCFPHILLPPAC